MSEYLLGKYLPVADALLAAHGLAVPDTSRHMLATCIMHNRELSPPKPRPPGSRSALPALRIARAHARKLIDYATHPPTREASITLRCVKLADAIRSNEPLVRLELVLADPPIDSNALLDELAAGRFDVDVLRRVVELADERECDHGGIGRPWATHTSVIRAGCIAWRRAGRTNDARWIMDKDRLAGALPDFVRDLIACCDGTHTLTAVNPRRAPIGYRDLALPARGDALRQRTPDRVIRDGIRAWDAWLREALRKNPNLNL